MENTLNLDYKELDTGYSSPGKAKALSKLFENRIWVDSKEAADYLRISYGALRNAVYRKQIIPRKFRRRLYFKVSELNRLLENSII